MYTYKIIMSICIDWYRYRKIERTRQEFHVILYVTSSIQVFSIYME